MFYLFSPNSPSLAMVLMPLTIGTSESESSIFPRSLLHSRNLYMRIKRRCLVPILITSPATSNILIPFISKIIYKMLHIVKKNTACMVHNVHETVSHSYHRN
jgi:hypothetical protein